MSSQYGEYAHIAAYFAGRIGRFLDIGANLQFSNTAALAEAGWSGLCVEPGPSAAHYLSEHYAGRPDIQIAEVAITANSGAVEFYESNCGGSYSTTEPEHKRTIESNSGGSVTFSAITVEGLTCKELFECYPPPFNFVNIDVEGRNADVLGWLLDQDDTAEMICVEISPPDDLRSMVSRLHRSGFSKQTVIGGNLLASK